jgi:hypothetical protein
MSFDIPFTSKSEDVTAAFAVIMDLVGKIEVVEKERKIVIDRLGRLISGFWKSDNPNLPVSSCYMNYLMGASKRAKEEDDDEVEELYVPTKKQKIENDHFASPSFPSSSSSSSSTIKQQLLLTNIHKHISALGQRRWRHLIRIPGITEARSKIGEKDGALKSI